MKQPITIKIPAPCNENWSDMNPAPTGRFCNACSKVVIDFTSMNSHELIAFFANADHRQVCGRFHRYQLNRPLQTIGPPVITTSLLQKFRKQLTAVFTGLLLLLASCNRRSDVKGQVNGNPIVLDSNYTKTAKDTIINQVEPPQKESHVKMGKTKTEPDMLTGEVVIEPESVQGGVVPFQPEPVEWADTTIVKK